MYLCKTAEDLLFPGKFCLGEGFTLFGVFSYAEQVEFHLAVEFARILFSL
jgi:hypothetical protein